MSKKTFELKLDQMAMGGEALGTHQGMKIFVPWGVTEDLVRVELTEERKDFARARILEVLEKSSHRTNPDCPYFFKCGGCQWQHIRYDSQIIFKQDLLKTALQRIAKISEPKLLEPVCAQNPFHYRNKIRLQVSGQGSLGFYKAQSKEVIAIEACLIAQGSLNEQLPQARKLAQLLFSKDKNKIHEIEVFGEEGKKVKVREVGEETHFIQSNTLQNLRLKELVKEALGLSRTENILELFAGDGNFTFDISLKAQQVLAVESNSQAVISAEEKISKGHFKNIEFVESSAQRFLQNPPNPPLSKGGKGGFDRILLDPPRTGMDQGITRLAKLKAPKIVYVSCDPATLARDLKELMDLGYQHESSQLIDMFPQTYHIESITCLNLP